MQRRFQLPPRLRPSGLADFVQLQGNDILQGTGYRALIQSRSLGNGRTPRTGRGFHPGRRQFNPALLLQLEQQGPRGHIFELALRRPPLPAPGQFSTEPVTTPVGLLTNQRLNLSELFGAERSALKHRR